MEFLKAQLPNGLEIVAEFDPNAHSAGYGFFVQTGSRDETDDISGVSHFLEHMVFKGTPHRSADDVNREFDEMGAHYNAFTSEENTVYHAAVLPEYQEPCVALLADIMRPSLRQADFDTEKKVIIEEIKMYSDEPPFGADDRLKAAFFGSHPMARSILGTEESIIALTAEQMLEYFRRRYSPGNILLAAAGRIDFDALVKQATDLCGAWDAVEAPRERPEVDAAEAFLVEQRDSAAQEYIMQLMSGPAANDADRFAAKILATVLGDDSGSRLYWELVDNGLAEHASLSHYDYDHAGVYMTSLGCEPERAAENLATLVAVLRDAEENGITQEELTQAQSKINSRIVLSSERPKNRLFNVGGNWLQRREYRSVRHDLDTVSAVSLDDIHAVMAKYPLTRGSTLAIGPLATLAQP
ncbi:MAG: insulinase family protein [Planctomycetales bacterium]|nr:insulinase family protein [Planctomycetales bacterium]